MIKSESKKGNRLDDTDKQIIWILASQQYSNRFIAQIIGCSIETVRLWRNKFGINNSYPNRWNWRAYRTVMSRILRG